MEGVIMRIVCRGLNAPGWARYFLFASGLVLTTGLSTGCGKGGGIGSLVQDVQVKTYEQDGELLGELRAQLTTGALILAGLDLPIVDPKKPGKVYGHVTINNNFGGGGGSELAVQLNLSQILNAAPMQSTLPNGTPIPVGGLGGAAVVALPVGSTGARVYVGLGTDVAMLGLALPFRQFDQIGQYVPGINLFQPFSSNKINGIVGIFTGANAGQNGLALFADLSGLIHKTEKTKVLAGLRSEMLASVAMDSGGAGAGRAAERLEFRDVKPSKWKTRQVYWMLNELNSERARLEVR